jgi:hypothetical protein
MLFGRKAAGKQKDTSPAQRSSVDASSETDDGRDQRIGGLIKSLQSGATREAELAFWKEVLGLPMWRLVTSVQGAADAVAGGGRPPITILNTGTSKLVPVYTNAKAASAAASHWAKEDGGGGGAHATLEMSMPGALAYLCTAFEGVENVMFDHVPGVSSGYGTQIDVLPGMYAYFFGPPPIECLDAMTRNASRSGHPNAYMDAYRVLATAPQLWMLRSKEGKPVLAPGQDGLVLAVFSDRRRADDQIANLEGATPIPCTLADVLKLDEAIRAQLKEEYDGPVVNIMTAPLGVNIEWMQRVLAG